MPSCFWTLFSFAETRKIFFYESNQRIPCNVRDTSSERQDWKLKHSHICLKKGCTWAFLFRVIGSSVQCSDAFVCSQRLFCLQILVKLEDQEMFLVMWWAFAEFFHALLLPSPSCFPCDYIQALSLPYWDLFSFCLAITWYLFPFLCRVCLKNTGFISRWNWKCESNFRWRKNKKMDEYILTIASKDL